MSGLPPYNSSLEARELWEITGALAEENRLRAGHLYCSECRHCDDPDRPWSCDKACPNRSHELFMIMLDMEDNWGPFWESINCAELRREP